jgi:hypothetical protein
MLVGLPLYHLRPRALGTTPGPSICASFQNGNTGGERSWYRRLSSDEARTRGIGDEKAAPTCWQACWPAYIRPSLTAFVSGLLLSRTPLLDYIHLPSPTETIHKLAFQQQPLENLKTDGKCTSPTCPHVPSTFTPSASQNTQRRPAYQWRYADSSPRQEAPLCSA